MNDGTMTKGFPPSYGGANKVTAAHDPDMDLAVKTGEPHDTVKDRVVEARDKIVEVKDKVIEIKDQVADRGSAALKGVRSFVTANPLKAVAVAFGIGFVGMRVTRMLRWL